jgi:AcrR family transcriptional regulator
MRTPRHLATRRVESAAHTRKIILDAARELFVRRGYPATTVGEVAAAAGVALATVYTSVGAKPLLLKAIIETGANDPNTARTVEAVRTATDPRAVIELIAAGTRHGNETHRDTLELLVRNADADELIAATVAEALAYYRRSLRAAAARLARLPALRTGLSVERATDVLWFYFGLHSWQRLVGDCGWSFDRAQHWLAERAAEALLG